MKEFREIIRAYKHYIAMRGKTALATVVHVEGSSYRRPGARMLINDEGQLTGAISGGCLEGDALRKALLVIAQQHTKLVTYDTTDEDDVSVGVQLGCSGVIQVLIEPIDVLSAFNPVMLLEKAISKRKKSVLVTFFSMEEKNGPQPGTCLLYEEDKTTTGHIPFADITETVMTDIQMVLRTGASQFINYDRNGRRITAFIELLQPPVSLVVVGAGNDAVPLVDMAGIIGWEARVVDGRNTHAKPERFVSACQVLVSKPEQALEQLPIDEHTVFVLMTHNYNYDLAMLKILLERNVTYIGVLGPKKKLERMLDELRENGMSISEKQLDSVFGPVGLDIGAETSEEIALSVIAEIRAFFSGKNGMFLRESKESIHSRTDTGIENRKLH